MVDGFSCLIKRQVFLFCIKCMKKKLCYIIYFLYGGSHLKVQVQTNVICYLSNLFYMINTTLWNSYSCILPCLWNRLQLQSALFKAKSIIEDEMVFKCFLKLIINNFYILKFTDCIYNNMYFKYKNIIFRAKRCIRTEEDTVRDFFYNKNC